VTSLSGYYFGQNKVNAEKTNWTVIQTMHFDIYVPKGNDEFVRLAALMAEETYYYLKNDFQFPLTVRIPLIIYSSQLEFQTTNIIYPLLSEGVGGFTESLKNRVALPFDGSYTKFEQVLTHELTHAYINGLTSGTPGSFFDLSTRNFPFWFAEGLPEYEAVGGNDVSNNNYIMDMVLNDRIGALNQADGYNAYRLGESFLAFLARRYGRDKMIDYFYAMRTINEPDAATKRVFGMTFKELEQRWHNQLKRDYCPYISRFTVPKEYAEARTDHQEEGSYFNLAPRIAPDGQKYIYFSNQGGRFSIWAGNLLDKPRNQKLITGEATGSMEEFHYLRSNLSWFPDSDRFAYVAKTAEGDKLYIADYNKASIIKAYDLPNLKTLYEFDIAPDGKGCVIVGQTGMRTDLYLFDFSTGNLERLTDNAYDEAQPRFSPDGHSIVFSSERTRIPETHRKGFFSGLQSNIYMLSLLDKQIKQVTFDSLDCNYPVWDSTGTKLLFVSEQDSVPNIDMIDLTNSKRTPLTHTLSGVYGFDLSPNSQTLVFSCFYNSGWDIFSRNIPLADTAYTACPVPGMISQVDSLLSGIDLKRLDYFGKRPPHKFYYEDRLRIGHEGETEINISAVPDSLKHKRDYSWDNRPDSISVVPAVKPYRLKYTLDRIWGGLAYSSSVGAIASVDLGLSDIMGNHAVGINLGITGKLKESNIQFTYLYLPHRIDYGVGVFNVFDEEYYRAYAGSYTYYFRSRERDTGLYLLFRYPLSKFFRLESEHLLYDWEYHWDAFQWVVYDESGYRDNDVDAVEKDIIYTPNLAMVYDNTMYGATGPMLGIREYTTLRKSFALHGHDYQTVYSDWRSYTLFNKRYSAAFRLVGGSSGGTQPEQFTLRGYYGVRGYEEREYGKNLSLASAELRFPFFDYINMVFPLPLSFTSIRGSAFSDIGGIWNKSSSFRGMQEDRLKDLKMGYGFGPRMNIGFAVFKIDVAWCTDLAQTSKPTYYFSLTEDF